MPYFAYAFLAIAIFSLVHLYGRCALRLPPVWQGRFLSAGGGIAIAYVFVDLLPKLCVNDTIVRNARYGVFLYFERHVYVMALAGFLLVSNCNMQVLSCETATVCPVHYPDA